MAGSVEYEILVRHTVDLQLAVKGNLIPLGAQLVAAQVITPDQYEEIRNAHRSVNDRGAELVGYVQNRVRQDPQHYYIFIGALKSDLSQYGDILTKLVIPQPPPIERQPVPAQGIVFVLVFVKFINIMMVVFWYRGS
jgi:hypothetical protein